MPQSPWSKEEIAFLSARVSAFNSHPKYSVARRVWVNQTTQKFIAAFPANKAKEFPVIHQVRPPHTSRAIHDSLC